MTRLPAPRITATPFALLIALGAILLAAALDAGVARAQRPAPFDALALVGRRHVVPLPQANDATEGATRTLHVSNIGWVPTRLAVVEVGLQAGDACPTAASPLRVLHCGQSVAPMALGDLPIADASGHLIVYSMAGDRSVVTAACQALESVVRGEQTLSQWEQRGAWSPGEPVSTQLTATDGAGRGTSIAGTPAYLDLVPAVAQRFASMSPSLPTVDEATTVHVANPSSECLTARVTWGPLHEAECPESALENAAVAAHGGRVLEAATDRGAVKLDTPQDAPAGIVPWAEHRDAAGWYAYGASVTHPEIRQFSIPLAAGLYDGLTSELWVTNHHITATTQVDIFMYSGAGQLHRLYTDPLPLCAGGARAYDITALAGEIPPGRGGPAMLSLRVTSTNLELVQAPPISGAIVLRSGDDEAAIAGATNVNPLLSLVGRDTPLDGRPVVVVPNVRSRAGTPAATTSLLMQDLRGLNQSRLYLSFYDRAGTLVFEDAYIALRGDAAGFLDLAQPLRQIGGGDRGTPLPEGFEGTVIVRPESPRSTLSVVAFDHPAGMSDQPTPPGVGLPFAVAQGVALIWPNDPNVPTPTVPPTRPVPTATPESTGHGLYLPLLLKDEL